MLVRDQGIGDLFLVTWLRYHGMGDLFLVMLEVRGLGTCFW